MRYKSTYEMLEPIVDSMDLEFTIDSIVDNTLFNYTILSCNTLWATVGFQITINTKVYVIKNIVPNVSITIQGEDILDLDTASFAMYPPVFYHGTIKATEYDLSKKIDGALLKKDRLPMIWLHEPTDEEVSEKELESIGMRSRCELYFMVDADFSAWDNEDHYTYGIIPMRNLIERFMDSVRVARTVNDNLLKKSKPRDLPRFSNYTGKDNKETTIFSMPMSGCGFEVEIPFIKSNALCC